MPFFRLHKHRTCFSIMIWASFYAFHVAVTGHDGWLPHDFRPVVAHCRPAENPQAAAEDDDKKMTAYHHDA